MTTHDSIQILIDKFQKKMKQDENAKKEIEPLTKTVNIDLGTEFYSLKLEKAQIVDFKDELRSDADIVLTTTPENFQALMNGELRPMMAYVTKKISVKGKLQDLMFLKKFF